MLLGQARIALRAEPAAGPQAAPRRQLVRCFANSDGSGAVSDGLTVRFRLPYRCHFGQQLCIVGNSEPLGKWEVQRGVPMRWTEGDVWEAELKLQPEGGSAELMYKYVVRNERTMAPVRWQEGQDSLLELPAAARGTVLVKEAWDAGHREVEFELAAPGAPAEQPAAQQPRPGRRRKGAANDEEAAVAAISRAADRALQQLDAAVSASMEMLDSSGDPASPDLLAADRVVAAAARRASVMSKALDAAASQKLLPSTEEEGGGGGKGAGAKGAGRRKRAPRAVASEQ